MNDFHALFQQCCGIDIADVAVPHKLLRLNASERNAHVINQVATKLLTQVQSAAGTIPPPQLQWMTQQVINARNAMLVQCGSQVQSPPTMPPVPPPVPQGHQYQSQHHSPASQAPDANPPIVVRTTVRRSGSASGAETALGVFGIIAMLTAAGFLGFLYRDQLFGSAKSPVPPRPPSPIVVPKGGGAGETVPGQAPELPPARPRPAPPAQPGRIADVQSHIKNAFSNLRKGFFDEADLDAQKALAVSPGLDEAEAMRLTAAYVRQYTGLAEDARKSLNGNNVVDLGPKWGRGAFIEMDEKSVTFRVRGKNKRFTFAELDAIPGARFRITAAFLDNAAIPVNDLILGAYQFVRQLDADGIVVRRGDEIPSRWLKASASEDQATAEQARLFLRLAELKLDE
jgi:hypothetical protein